MVDLDSAHNDHLDTKQISDDGNDHIQRLEVGSNARTKNQTLAPSLESIVRFLVSFILVRARSHS